jgi:DNA-binding protein HU-beta
MTRSRGVPRADLPAGGAVVLGAESAMYPLNLPAEPFDAAPARVAVLPGPERSPSAPSVPRRRRRAAERGDGNAVTHCPEGEATDKNALVEAAARRTADADQPSAAEQVERMIDALFGTVEHPGVIVEGLKRGGAVTVLGFGAFHLDDARATLWPGQALNEHVSGAVG